MVGAVVVVGVADAAAAVLGVVVVVGVNPIASVLLFTWSVGATNLGPAEFPLVLTTLPSWSLVIGGGNGRCIDLTCGTGTALTSFSISISSLGSSSYSNCNWSNGVRLIVIL